MNNIYDYIIVGAGAAGCVLANRLSADPAVRVLLLEAGGRDRNPYFHMPAAFNKLFRTAADWNYEAEGPIPGQAQYWPRGKVLGGSDSINAMMYVRGHACDYDHWAALGNAGWGYQDVLPYFQRAEGSVVPDSPSLGTDGPMHITLPRTANPLTETFIAAAQSLGLEHNPDYNGPDQDGVALTLLKQKLGRRWSAADAYLKPALSRRNLTVQTQAQVSRVLFEGTRAVGVEYRRGGLQQAKARREVILCGGAVNSPQLLMLSGIGPAAHLEEHGIGVVVDLPGVGQNLQDHPASGASNACTLPVTLINGEKLPALYTYLRHKRGPLTSNVAEALAFIRISENAPAPDIELLFAPAFFNYHGFRSPKGHGFTLGAILLRPKSRGQITLRSADPFDRPRIEPRYFTEPDDLALMVEGVKTARRVLNAAPFDQYRGIEVYPGPDLTTDEQIGQYVLREFQSLYHPVGTCKMGPEGDPMAVVDAELRVRGVEGLRVVDASIMPTVPGGHTVAPTIMIGEKAAEEIVKEVASAVAPVEKQTESRVRARAKD